MTLEDYRTARRLKASGVSQTALIMAAIMQGGPEAKALRVAFRDIAGELHARFMAPQRGRLRGDPPDPAPTPPSPADVLTDRELDVVKAVAQGKTNAEVAAALGLRQHTIKTHLARISTKLGVHGRAALVGAVSGFTAPEVTE